LRFSGDSEEVPVLKRFVTGLLIVLAAGSVSSTYSVPSATVAAAPPPLPLQIEYFNFPGGSSTKAFAINDAGTIVGSYIAENGREVGFIRTSDQVWTTVVYPAADVTRTQLLGINNHGQIVGCYYTYYDVPGACYYGFLLSGGVFTPITYPGAFITTPTGINDAGDIVGWSGWPGRGFLLRGGTFTTLDSPSASPTFAYGIDNEPDPTVVGAHGGPHKGFVRKLGVWTDIEYPDATATIANGVNAARQIAGSYVIEGSQVYSGGFLLTQGVFSSFEISPGSVYGLNNANQIVGDHYDQLFGWRAFVATFTGTPMLSHARPASGAPGQTGLNVLVTGAFTHFDEDTTVALGAGITVNSVIVHNPNQATANVTIAPGAALGTRTITVTTGSEVVTLADGFAVTSDASPTITLVTPATYPQGAATIDVVVSGGSTHFVQGTTTANFGGDITVNSVTVQSPTQATVNITLASTIPTGPRTVRLSTGAEVVSLVDGFLVSGPPRVVRLTPTQFRRLQANVSVQVIGEFTHFTQGTTTVDFGAGVTVNSVTVQSPTLATATITISGSATFGIKPVTVTTGSEILVRNNNFVIWPTENRGDYSGDAAVDMTVYRPSDGTWRTKATNVPTPYIETWGANGDIPVPGDYDGDQYPERAVFRPSTGAWYLRGVGAQPWLGITWGVSGDVPVPADYDGDGATDVAVYRPSTGDWLVLTAASGFASSLSVPWGVAGDVPAVGDYDGDMKADFAVFRPSTGAWFILHSVGGYTMWTQRQWGLQGDVPVTADYDNDSIADIAVYRPSEGIWFILQSTTGFTSGIAYYWGASGDVPVPGDYDGDGKADPAVYRESSGTWFFMRSRGGPAWAVHQWGEPGDVPVLRRQ
jgi:hypothetical protein